MRMNIFKKAFSLTELLIVLVIIAVLFAALAPIITKRNHSSELANEPVWNFVTNAKDIFFDPGVPGLTSAAYFGFSPSALSDQKPYAKVYLRAKNDQNHIQFRYGDGNGKVTGVFAIDGDSVITSSKHEKTSSTSAVATHGNAMTIAGHRAYVKGNGAADSESTAIGNAAMAEPGGSGASINTVIGANAGQYLNGSNNILIGANTGRGKTNTIKNTVAVGGRVLSIDESSGNNNVFVGYGVATAGFSSDSAAKNTILASQMYGKEQAARNTIVGYGTYDAAYEYAHDVTAVGYNACSSIQMKSGYSADSDSPAGPKTCIGYGSADKAGLTSALAPTNWTPTFDPWSNDIYDHVFIGGTPNGFNGRAVLEVHNMGSAQAGSASWKPNIAPTVVLNSHLVVRGNVFFPFAESGDLTAHATTTPITNVKSTENGGDRCGRKCIGRKRWWARPKCKLLGAVIGAIVGAVTAVLSIPTAGLASVVYVTVWGGLASGTLGSLFNGNNYKRLKEPPTGAIFYMSENITDGTHELDPKCITSSGSAYPDSQYCPNLHLSDIRLKENITENTDALDKIMYVMPYNYTFKNDTSKKAMVGVMAQDLQKYLPNDVFTGKDGYLGIQWDGMFYAVINSIKELDKQTQALAADTEAMEKDTAALKTSHKNTQKRIKELNKRINKLEK